MIDVGGFSDVDATGDPSAFATWMAHQRRFGPDRALDLLELHDDQRVLDLGCGSGADLGALRGRAGHAFGLDRSFEMATTARTSIAHETSADPVTSVGSAHRVVRGASADVVCGDAAALPFADDSFDACWSRAVVIHCPNPATVIAEIARVAGPGARVFSEPDHGTHAVATSESAVFERVKAFRRTMFRKPLIGRCLPDLATQAGLLVTHMFAVPIVHRSFATARASGGPFDATVDAAVDQGAISRVEVHSRSSRSP